MILNVFFFFHGIPPHGDIIFEKYFGFQMKNWTLKWRNFRPPGQIFLQHRQHNSFTNNMNDLRLYIFLNINISCEKLQQIC